MIAMCCASLTVIHYNINIVVEGFTYYMLTKIMHNCMLIIVVNKFSPSPYLVLVHPHWRRQSCK